MNTLDLGCGDRPEHWKPNSDGVDIFDYGQKYIFNLCNKNWPIESNIYNRIVAQHILEHIEGGWDFINILNEIWRVGKPGAIFAGACPHFPSSPNYYRDPTHVRPINEYTFEAFYVNSAIHFGTGYNVKCKFKPHRVWVDSNRDIRWELEIIK